MAESAASPNFTEIILPYSAFDLTASWPIYNTSTPYFPIRRSPTGIFVLGRILLQEAYLAVDYERGNWSLGRANFPETSPIPSIVPIPPPGQPKQSSSGIGAGIAVAIIIVISAIALGCLCCRRKARRQNAAKVADPPLPEMADSSLELYNNLGGHKRALSETETSELEGKSWIEARSTNHSRGPSDASNTSYELDIVGQRPAELPADSGTGRTQSPPSGTRRGLSPGVREERRGSDQRMGHPVRRMLTVVREVEVPEDEERIERASDISLEAVQDMEMEKKGQSF